MAKKFIYFDSTVNGNTESNAYETTDYLNSSAGAGDAGKPVVLDAAGHIDATMINDADIDHGTIGGLGDDDHTQYILVAGTRAFTGPQSMGTNKITALSPGTVSTDAVNLSQLNAVQNGMDWKDSVRFATTAVLPTYTGTGTGTLTLTALTAWSPDGTAVVDGDRILVKSEGAADVDHGIYVVSGVGALVVLTRSSDADADVEVTASLTVSVSEGTVNADTVWHITTNDPIVVNTTAIDFGKMVIEAYTASLGVALSGNDFRADLLASGGLKLTGNEIGVEPNDFAGAGLVDDGADNMAIDWSTAFNDAKAVKAEDLNSVTNGEGASIIGVEDSGGNFIATDVEAALLELYNSIADTGVTYTVGTGGVAKGDVVYVSANDTVLDVSSLTADVKPIGLAASAESAAASVIVLADDTVVTGVLTGATAGDTYYWNGSAHTTTPTSTASQWVIQTGVAKNATDLHVEVLRRKKNA